MVTYLNVFFNFLKYQKKIVRNYSKILQFNIPVFLFNYSFYILLLFKNNYSKNLKCTTLFIHTTYVRHKT